VVDHGLFSSCSGVDCFGRTSWPVRNTPTSATTVTVAIVPPVFGWPLMTRYTPKLLKTMASMNAIHWLCLRAAYIVFRSSIRAVIWVSGVCEGELELVIVFGSRLCSESDLSFVVKSVFGFELSLEG